MTNEELAKLIVAFFVEKAGAKLDVDGFEIDDRDSNWGFNALELAQRISAALQGEKQ